MKGKHKVLLLAALLSLGCVLSACGGPGAETAAPTVPTGESLPSTQPAPTQEPTGDRPTIPEDVAEGIEYLYDFRFSQRYDDRVSNSFSLTIPGVEKPLTLFERYQSDMEPEREFTYDGDGLVPHMYRRYWYTLKDGASLLVETDFYEPDGVEYISYLWTNAEGAKTDLNIGVGSSEEELLGAYTEGLYYLEKEQAEPEVQKMAGDPEPDFRFDCGYTWQPFTQESNDIRDVTFYLQEGKVTSVEVMNPFELRYVYGYDRQAGLDDADAKRAEHQKRAKG